jgi:ABC-type transporter Mla subunit MlaD
LRALALAVGSAALLAGCGGSSEPEHRELEAVFTSKRGIEKGIPVRIAGVPSGKVTEVESGPRRTFVVTMELKDSARSLHAGASVTARPQIFKQREWFLDLRRGKPSAPELPDGYRLPLRSTTSAGEVEIRR